MEYQSVDLSIRIVDIEDFKQKINALKMAGLMDPNHVCDISIPCNENSLKYVSQLFARQLKKRKLPEEFIVSDDIKYLQPEVKKQKVLSLINNNKDILEELFIEERKPEFEKNKNDIIKDVVPQIKHKNSIPRKSMIYHIKDKLIPKIIKKNFLASIKEFGFENNIEFHLHDDKGYIEYYGKDSNIVDIGFVEEYLELTKREILKEIKTKDIKANDEELRFMIKLLNKELSDSIVDIDGIHLNEGGQNINSKDILKKQFVVNNEFMLKIVEDNPLSLNPNYLICNISEDGIYLDEITAALFKKKEIKQGFKKANVLSPNIRFFQLDDQHNKTFIFFQSFKVLLSLLF